MTGKRFALAAVLLAGLVSGVNADSWSYKPISEDKSYQFGSVKVVLTTDATRDQKYPDFTVRIFRGGIMQAQYRGIAFEHLVAAPDESVIVGLSNDGLPGTAIVVFGPSGELRLLVRHRMAEFDYCDKTVTRRRVWFDKENPDVRFDFNNREHGASGISLRDCRGNRVDIWATALKAYNNALQRTPASGRR
jgi:hypothetical protein